MVSRPHHDRSQHTLCYLTRLLAAAALVSLLAGAPAAALRLPEPAPGLRAEIHTLWNENYLCLAAKVADLMVTGSSAGPMSAPQQDDAIEFDLEVPGPAGPQAYRLIVSAAGGMTLFGRDARGRWRSDPSWISGPQTVKYAVTLQGTLNNPADTDVGYTVECAIPWQFLGGQPLMGREIGFNVVCWMQGESEGLASWSQTVRSDQDANDTTRWGRLLISTSSALATAQGTWLPCPYMGRTPFVDGKLGADEWLIASTLTVEKPKPSLAPAPTPQQQTGTVGTLLAIYRYDWQGDPSRPGAPLWRREGGPATSDQPKEGAGPWYSWERVAWHRAQLDEVQRSGIDIILARYSGDEESRRGWARTGLDRLSEALKGMRAEGHSYPLVGMFLDTVPLSGVDLKSEDGQRLCYGMIRDFFRHVPREFWAELGAGPAQGATGGVPVLLGEPDGLADWDGSFLAFAQERFGRDFPGARLIWLGSSRWRARGAEAFYAYLRLPQEAGFSQDSGQGGASAVALSPGFCPAPGAGGSIRSRRDGRAYRADWQRVLAGAPELVLLNSWNDFSNGTELAPSRQYGFAYVDLTRYFATRLASQQPRPLRLRKHNLPAVLRPGTDYLVELLVENAGTEDLHTGRTITADHRIARRADGKVVQSRIAAQGLDIMAGQTLRLPVLISTKDDRGSPLPPGEYVFSLAATRSKLPYLRSRWFARTAAELELPITVGEPPARRVTVVSTSLPSAVEAGAAEQVVVRLRNDGAESWRAADTALSYQWVRCEGDLVHPAEQPTAPGARAALPKDVAPGEVVSVMIPVSATQADGTPLPTPGAGDLWHYRVQWNLLDGSGRWFPGPRPASEAIQVIPLDRGVRFESAATPATMEAGQAVQVEVVVANAGPRVWAAADSALTYHWHCWDGRELAMIPARTPLPSDLAPGGKLALVASVRAPDAAGPYWLVWDVVANGQGYADVAGGRRAEMLVAPVMVQGGSLHTLDLSNLANVVAVTDDSHRTRGDLDGQGRSLPAEWLPPDQSGAADRIYPGGYYCPSPPAGVPFVFPDASSGLAGAVACDGQTIPLGDQGVKAVHLLLASTAQQEQASFGLRLASGEVEQVMLEVPAWTGSAGLPAGLVEGSQPAAGDDVGAHTPCLRTATGDDASTSGNLYHRALAASKGPAVALVLPQQPSVKILAITVEDP